MFVYKRFNPVEYRSEEEAERSEIRFTIYDLFMRGVGYVQALKDSNRNQIVK